MRWATNVTDGVEFSNPILIWFTVRQVTVVITLVARDAVDDGFKIVPSLVDGCCKVEEPPPLITIQISADLRSILAVVGVFGGDLDTGGKGAYTQWVHCGYIVGSETICPPQTQQVSGGFF